MSVSLEVEAKFALSHLAVMRQHVLDQGGHLLHDRTLERNWRFDTADGRLTSTNQVLRLRQDVVHTLTYKQAETDPMARTEVEFEIDQPDSARRFLEALGYQVILIYEKYRESFALEGCLVVLDQLPFGQFVEIEKDSSKGILPVIQKLGLQLQDQVKMGYAEVFSEWKRRTGHTFRDATFQAFAEIEPIKPEDIGLVDSLKTIIANLNLSHDD